MKVYEVVTYGRVREVYRVNARTEDEAAQLWMEQEPMVSEVSDTELIKVEEVGD